MEIIKESSLTVFDVHIDSFVCNGANVNEMTEDELRKLCTTISEVGFISPVECIKTEDNKFMLLGGEHRIKAAKILGMTYVPAVVLTDAKWSEADLLDLTAFRLNNITGSVNIEKFVKLYERFALKFGADSMKDVFSVTDKSLWKRLTKSIKTDMKKAGLPNDIVEKVDEADKKAKDFNQFTKAVAKVFKDKTELANGCILFTLGKSEHMVVHASAGVFQSMKAISSLASSNGKNINDYLEEVLLNLLRDLR